MSDQPNTVAGNVRAVIDPRTDYSRTHLVALRIVTVVSWLLVVLTSFYYSFRRPHDGIAKHQRGNTIWGQNRAHHTPFALNTVISSIYWIVTYLVQIPYLYHLYAPADYIVPAAQLAHAFTINNLFGFGFIHLWVRGYFGWALLLVILNWFNLTLTYFRYPKHPKLIHIAVLALPLAFTFVSLYWVGAAAVHARNLPSRIIANIFVWTWLVYGGFYLVAFKDWALGFALSVLTAALGVAQFLTVIVALQWIFAFTIMALLFVGSVIVAFPDATGIQLGRGQVVDEDRERAPLLSNEN